ncbi:MAG: hypothetical protein CMJ76_05660 [Planctomycetaceae bacterium]|nr:hypothetical protein [Planctomycetaceae bacterium]
MPKQVKSESNPRLRGGERLEDRRLLAFGGAACKLMSDPVTPKEGIALGESFIVGDAEPVKRKHLPRIALFDSQQDLPDRFTIEATVNSSIDPLATGCSRLRQRGLQTNGMLVFDYENDRNYKFAGFDARRNLWLLGGRFRNRFYVHDRLREPIQANQTFELKLNIEGSRAELLANGELKVSHSFMALDKTNPLGIGVLIPRPTEFKDLTISDYFPLTKTFSDRFRTVQGMTEIIDVLANDQVAYDVDATLALSETEFDLGQASVVNNQLQFQADDARFGEQLITYDVVDQFGRIVSGELTLSISSQFPIQYEWNHDAPTDLALLQGTHDNLLTTHTSLHRLTGLELLEIGIPPEQFTMTTSVVPHPNNPRANGGGYFVFDYVDTENYKYAGILGGKKTAIIAELRNGRNIPLKSHFIGKLENYEYDLRLFVHGNQVRLLINDQQYLSREFPDDVSAGHVGLKGHRRGSIFKPLTIDNINQPSVGINNYHKVAVHEDVTLNHFIQLPEDAVIASASTPHGTINVKDNELTYRSAPHHWGPTNIEYEIQFANGVTANRTLPIAPGVNFPASAKLTPFGYLESDIVMNDYGFKIQGKEFFQENQYPLPFGGFESITNFNLLFLNDTLPKDFDIVLQSQDVNEEDFAKEPIIFDYHDQLNYKFVGMTRVIGSSRSSTIIGTIVNSTMYPDRTFWTIGEVVNGEERILHQARRNVNLHNNLSVRVRVRDNRITVFANSSRITSYEFPETLRYGTVGVYSPYADRAYHTLSILPAEELIEAANYNQQLNGEMWHISDNVIEVQPASEGLSVYMLPNTFVGQQQLTSHVTSLSNAPDEFANAYIVFDHIDNENFKLAGIQIGTQSIVIAEVKDGHFLPVRTKNYTMTVGQDIQLKIILQGSTVTLIAEEQEALSYTFTDDELLTHFGYATQKSPAYFKNTRLD